MPPLDPEVRLRTLSIQIFIWASTQKFLPPRAPIFSEDIKKEKYLLEEHGNETYMWSRAMNVYGHFSVGSQVISTGLQMVWDELKVVHVPRSWHFIPLSLRARIWWAGGFWSICPNNKWDLSSFQSAQKHKTTQEAEVICFISHRIKKSGLHWGIRILALCPSSQDTSGSFDTHHLAGWTSERCPPPWLPGIACL